MVTLLTDVPHIDSCAKLHKFSAILASLFVFFISLVSLILVHTVLNNFYFRMLRLLKILYFIHLLFFFNLLVAQRLPLLTVRQHHFTCDHPEAVIPTCIT